MDKIAVIDLGGQYAHLIANRVRRLGVYSEIVDNNAGANTLKRYKGIILSGGPQSVYAKNSPQIDSAILGLGIPILGICYGHQLIVQTLGGKVNPGTAKEYGIAKLNVLKKEGILKGLPAETTVWMSHGDEVSRLPKGFEEIGNSVDARYSVVADLKKKLYGVQFHVEVTHTRHGIAMLKNFLRICRVRKSWDMASFLKTEIKKTRTQVGDKKVFMLVSGGVDSLVAFTLLNRAIGAENVYGLFVDTGFMRLDEGTEVKKALGKLKFKNFHGVDASLEFFKAVKKIDRRYVFESSA